MRVQPRRDRRGRGEDDTLAVERVIGEVHADAAGGNFDALNGCVEGYVQSGRQRLRQRTDSAAECQGARPPRPELHQRQRERLGHPVERLKVEALDKGREEVVGNTPTEDATAPLARVLVVVLVPGRVIAERKLGKRATELRPAPAEAETFAPGQRAAADETQRVRVARAPDLAAADDCNPWARFLQRRLQRRLAAERQHVLVRARQELRAAVDDDAVDLVARHASADAPGRLEHRDVEAVPHELGGRGESRQARADNDDRHAMSLCRGHRAGRASRPSPTGRALGLVLGHVLLRTVDRRTRTPYVGQPTIVDHERRGAR